MSKPFFLPITAIIVLIIGFSSRAAHAQFIVEQPLYGFSGGATDGANPVSALVNVNGILYGTTQGGGPHNDGTIFSINPFTHTQTILHSFGGSKTQGRFPLSGFVNVNGILYGTTENGGPAGQGIVYSFNPTTNKVSTLHSFLDTGGDGVDPQSDLIAVNGVLYGTTAGGGTKGLGTIYSLDLSTNTEKILYSFLGSSDGELPSSGLLHLNGVLFGVAEIGGTNKSGILFSFDLATNTEHILHTFTGTDTNGDGAGPLGKLINVDGTLYGITEGGGIDRRGTVYSMKPNGTGYLVRHSFAIDGIDGSSPEDGLVDVNGTLIGVTDRGGADNNGSVYTFDPATDTESVLYSFLGSNNSDGSIPARSVLDVNGTLFGTTFEGGPKGVGTIYSLASIFPPTTKNDSGRTNFNTTLNIAAPGVLTNDNNGGDPNTTAAVVTPPTHGTLTFHSDGSFIYVPNTGFLGTDRFTYRDTNLAGTSSDATCTLTVQATVPTAKNDSNVAKYETTLTIAAPGILNDDSSGGSSPITAALVTSTSHGTLALSSNGGYKYTPHTGFVGNDTFTYQAANAIGKSNIATVTISVQPTAPSAKNNSNNVKKNTTLSIPAPGVLGNDDNGGKAPLTATLVTGTAHGTVTLNGNGAFTYTPSANFTGTDSFTYQAVNSIGKSNIATATLIIQ